MRRLERFRAKWTPVRAKKTRQNKRPEPRSDSIRTEKALIVMIAVVTFFVAMLPCAIAQTASDEPDIRATLKQWMADFNAGRADKVCDIFAPVLRADVRGAGERDFDARCKLVRVALADRERSLPSGLDIGDM